MKHFVVGLAFNEAADRVALIEKARPAWLAGKFNGIGGKVEEGEAALPALSREFWEETGVVLPPSLWRPIAVLQDEIARIDIFSAFSDRIERAYSTTDEKVMILPVQDPLITAKGVPDLARLVARGLARERADILYLRTSNPATQKPLSPASL